MLLKTFNGSTLHHRCIFEADHTSASTAFFRTSWGCIQTPKNNHANSECPSDRRDFSNFFCSFQFTNLFTNDKVLMHNKCDDWTTGVHYCSKMYRLLFWLTVYSISLEIQDSDYCVQSAHQRLRNKIVSREPLNLRRKSLIKFLICTSNRHISNLNLRAAVSAYRPHFSQRPTRRIIFNAVVAILERACDISNSCLLSLKTLWSSLFCLTNQ